MCTFCGKSHNQVASEKTIIVYDKDNKILGSFNVPSSWSVQRYQRGLYRKYPNWYRTS